MSDVEDSHQPDQQTTPDSQTDPPARRLTAGVQWQRYERYPYLLAKLVFFGLIVAGLLWLLATMSAVVFPVFMALLLAYLFNPMVGFFQKRDVPRAGGIVIILVGLFLFVFVFAWFLYPTMVEQVRRIGERAPQAWEFLETEFFPWITETLGVEFPETVEEVFEQYGEEIGDAVPMIAERAAEWTGEVVTRTQVILVSLFNLIMIPIFTAYFLYDFERMKTKARQFIPQARREMILDRLRKMDLAVGQWFRGQVEVSIILAVLYAIGLGLVYGLTGHDVQSGVVIGLLTGFLNVIPYLGFAVGSLLAFLVILIEWTGWWALIGVTLAFVIIQTAESYYITPRVMGDKVGLSPVVVIIVLLIGGHAAGLLGVILAIPIFGALKVLFPDLIRWYRNSSVYTGVPVVPADADVASVRQTTERQRSGGESAPPRETPDDVTGQAPGEEPPRDDAPEGTTGETDRDEARGERGEDEPADTRDRPDPPEGEDERQPEPSHGEPDDTDAAERDDDSEEQPGEGES